MLFYFETWQCYQLRIEGICLNKEIDNFLMANLSDRQNNRSLNLDNTGMWGSSLSFFWGDISNIFFLLFKTYSSWNDVLQESTYTPELFGEDYIRRYAHFLL